MVAGLPPPPVISRNFKGIPVTLRDGRVVKGEGRIGSYSVDKRVADEAAAREAADRDPSGDPDPLLTPTEGSGGGAGGMDGVLKIGREGGRPGCGGSSASVPGPDRTNRRKSNDPPGNARVGGGAGGRGRNYEPVGGGGNGGGGGGGKKESTLRFAAIMDKRNGNKTVPHAGKRVVNSGRLVLEASYDELPECFHIGHNPESFYPPEIRRAIHNVQFIHTHMVQQDKFDEVCKLSFCFSYRVFSWRLLK